MAIHIGFTGTRQGMTDQQKIEAEQLYYHLANGNSVLHHGDCIGADDEMHTIGYEMGAEIWIHPCDLRAQRAFADKRLHAQSTLIYPIKPPLTRNRDIVRDCLVLIATPSGPETPRGGTWYTIRYAERQGRPVYIIYPDGSIERRN